MGVRLCFRMFLVRMAYYFLVGLTLFTVGPIRGARNTGIMPVYTISNQEIETLEPLPLQCLVKT